MQLKRFFAKDNHSALKLVREDIGPDAIIVSNRKTENGVEVIATADYDETAIQRAAAMPADSEAAVSAPVATEQLAEVTADNPPPAQPQSATPPASDFASTLADAADNTTIKDMRNELNNLRTMLDTQLAAFQAGQWGQQSPARAELFEKLTQIGLGVERITQLISATEISDDLETASRKVLMALKDSIHISEHDAIERGGIVVLHGPTGAGKTTSIAKLAAQFLRNHDPRDLVMVCADNGRVGAYEQLQTFAKLLGVSVVRVRHSAELGNVLSVLGSKKIVLLDSAGMVQADLRNPRQLIGMDSGLENIHHYLILAATMQRSAMERILDSLSGTEIDGVILTKLDEAVHLGDVLTSLLRHDIPLTSWADGQNIASDIHRADAAVLVSKAMHLNKTVVESKDDRILFSMLQARQDASSLWH